MTATRGANIGMAPLARVINRHGAQLQAQATASTQYTLDATGSCTFISGDISHAPLNSYTDHPSMEPTGLSGWGAASKKTGVWVQL